MYTLDSSDSEKTIECSKIIENDRTYYIYDAYSDKIYICSDPNYSINTTGFVGGYNILSINTRATYKINGVSIPLSEYPIGSSFDIKFENASECHGFGLYVYDKIWGSTSYGQQISRGSILNSTMAEQYLRTIPAGSLVRFSDSVHTVIVLSTSSTGITVYHANWLNNNLVTITTFTYDSIASRWGGIKFVKIPCSSHSVKTWTSEGSTLHSQKCSACGYKQKFGEHYAETAGYGTCLARGYVGYITIGINKAINVIK